MYSPLEQFDVIYLIGLTIPGLYLDISLFNVAIPLLLIIGAVYLLTIFFSNNITLTASGWQQILEASYFFIWNLIKEQAGSRGLNFFPFIYALFFLLLLANLLSLMPFGVAITSHIIITLFLSFTLILSLFVLGLYNFNLAFLRLFIPECPFALLFLLVPIELFSYFVRCFSLAIRLSANILAGHTLVFIVSGFLLKIATLRLWMFLPLVSLLLLLFLLEFGVAFLQAYVFVVLFCIYLRDSLYSPTH
jgi:F-type H+-transporting ATPase subunit a